MADEKDFEPRLGQPGKDRRHRPSSQLSALARSARWGKVHTFGRPKLAWGTVRHQGRGKGAAAIARHHAHPSRRRLFLQTSIAVAGSSGTKAFAAHIAYIARDGTSDREGPGRVFDRTNDDADQQAFNKRARGDVRQFRWMVSPDDAGEMQDLTRFTRILMKQVERDLRREVDWVAASHFNTAHPHIHIAVRGGTPEIDELIIARRYLTHGLRHRAEETISSELGLGRALEIAPNMSRAVEDDRYTSIDKDLHRAAQSGVVDLSGPYQGPAGSSWSARLSRLCHLRSRGLAEHLGGSTWRLQPGWTETLRRMGQQLDLQQDMSAALGSRLDPGSLQEFSTGKPGVAVTGRLAGVVAERTPTGRHVVVLEGLDGRQWTAAMPAREVRTLPEPGSVITIVSAPAISVAGSPQKRGMEPGPPVQPVRFVVDAWIPVEEQVRRKAYTWLDQLDGTSLEDAVGFGAEVRAARLARQLWLRSEGLYPAARETLQADELGDVAGAEANRLGKKFKEVADREIFRGIYAGYVDTAQGRFAVIAGETRFTLAAWTEGEAPAPGQQALVERGAIAFGRVLNRAQTITH